MTEPQGWALIGVFTTIMLGGFTFLSLNFTRVLRSEVGRLDARLTGEIGSLRTELKSVEQTLSTKIDHLDRDVSSLARRVWGDPPA